MEKHAKVIMYGAAASVLGMLVWALIEGPVHAALGIQDDSKNPANTPQGPQQEATFWNNLMGRNG